MNTHVTVQVPATTANCGPGFDSVGIACTLYNQLQITTVASANAAVVIDIAGEGATVLPRGASNIVVRAIQTVFDEVGTKCPALTLKMVNAIPLARGLGSSAAAIVAGLVGANALLGNPLNNEQLLTLATKLEGHPDNVAPALYGGVTVSAVAAERVETIKLLPPAPLTLVVAVPAFQLATRAARQVLPDTVPLTDAVFNISRTALLIGALTSGKYECLATALDDKLHQPYRQALIPGMQDVLAAAKAAGAFGAALSGAGPCLIAFTQTNATNVGQAMINAFADQQISADYLCLDVDLTGAKILTSA